MDIDQIIEGIRQKAEQDVEQFLQKFIAEGLKKLTEEQQSFFHRLYPGGVSKLNLKTAAGQIERTIRKNESQQLNLF